MTVGPYLHECDAQSASIKCDHIFILSAPNNKHTCTRSQVSFDLTSAYHFLNFRQGNRPWLALVYSEVIYSQLCQDEVRDAARRQNSLGCNFTCASNWSVPLADDNSKYCNLLLAANFKFTNCTLDADASVFILNKENKTIEVNCKKYSSSFSLW